MMSGFSSSACRSTSRSYGPMRVGLQIGHDHDPHRAVDLRAGDPPVRDFQPVRLDQKGIGGDQQHGQRRPQGGPAGQPRSAAAARGSPWPPAAPGHAGRRRRPKAGRRRSGPRNIRPRMLAKRQGNRAGARHRAAPNQQALAPAERARSRRHRRPASRGCTAESRESLYRQSPGSSRANRESAVAWDWWLMYRYANAASGRAARLRRTLRPLAEIATRRLNNGAS